LTDHPPTVRNCCRELPAKKHLRTTTQRHVTINPDTLLLTCHSSIRFIWIKQLGKYKQTETDKTH